MMNETEKNYYEILEIATNANPDEVQNGYTLAKSAYGHDSLALYSLMSKEECNTILGLIEEAYTIISDPSKRTQYDDARGINLRYLGHHVHAPSTYNQQQQSQMNIDKQGNHTQRNITKLVATSKYSLDFEENANFESEIEQTIDFTGEFLRKN